MTKIKYGVSYSIRPLASFLLAFLPLALLFDSTVVPPVTQSYVYRGSCSSLLLVTYPLALSSIPSVRYVHYAVSKTYHLYQCRSDLCASLAVTTILVYKPTVDKPLWCISVSPNLS